MNKVVEYLDIDFDLEYDFYPAERQVYNYGDGSGYPGAGAEVDIRSIKVGDYDVYDVLQQSVIDKLHELLIEAHE